MYFARYYLKSSRELKRIEAIKCSPVYSHVTETVDGLEVVHTSNMSKTFIDRLKWLVSSYPLVASKRGRQEKHDLYRKRGVPQTEYLFDLFEGSFRQLEKQILTT